MIMYVVHGRVTAKINRTLCVVYRGWLVRGDSSFIPDRPGHISCVLLNEEGDSKYESALLMEKLTKLMLLGGRSEHLERLMSLLWVVVTVRTSSHPIIINRSCSQHLCYF
jgi:hypothetical protein